MKIESNVINDLDKYFTARKYGQAIKLLKSVLAQHSNDLSLRMKLADAYTLDGNHEEAEKILSEIAMQLAKAGYITKAIAIQKKIQRMNPDSELDIYKYIEELEKKNSPAVSKQKANDNQDHADSPDSKMKALDRLFKGLTKDEFKEVFSRLEQKEFPSGEYVFKEGDEDSSVYIIISGSVKVLLDHGDEILELATLNDSDFFGEVALLTGKARTASVLCIVDSEFLILNRENYRALSKKYSGLQESLAAALEYRAQKTIEILIES